MAETLPGHSFILKQTNTFNRPFFFGTTGQAASMVVKLSKNAGAGVSNSGGAGAITEIDVTNLPGWYNLVLSTLDTNTSGILAYHVSAGSGGPADFADIIEPQVFRDLQMVGGTGSLPVAVSSNLKQNQPFAALFLMTQVGTTNPAPGLTPTGQRTFGIAGFSNVSGGVAEVGGTNNGGGWYVFNGLAADSNSPQAGFKFSAPGANDSDFSLWFQP